MPDSGSIYLTDSNLFLPAFGVESNAGIYTQQCNNDTDHCEKQNNIFQDIFHSLHLIKVILKCAYLTRNIFRQHLLTDSFNPLHYFLLLLRIAFHITMSYIYGWIIEYKSVTAAMIMNIGLTPIFIII